MQHTLPFLLSKLQVRGLLLNQHPHIHVSVTCSGLDVKNGVCHELFFRKKAVEEIWCGAMTRLLHHSCGLINPGSPQSGGTSAIKNSVSIL
ncbi:transposase [Salmonella enterica]|nr:transposase [Salmonella enterica]